MIGGLPAWEIAVLVFVIWIVFITWYSDHFIQTVANGLNALNEHKDDIIVSIISLMMVGRGLALGDQHFLEWVTSTSAVLFIMGIGAALGASRSGRGIREWLKNKSNIMNDSDSN